MGRHLQHESSTGGFSVRSSHPGCTWNIFHILKYHHWGYIKSKLPHRRRSGGRRSVGDGNPGTHKVQEQNVEDNHSDGKKVTKSTASTKSSVTSKIIALISEEVSKRKGRHHRSSTYPARSHLIRTDSLHHLELQNQDPLAEITLDDLNPDILDQSKESSCETNGLHKVQHNSSEKPAASENNLERSRDQLSAEDLEHNLVNKNGKQQILNGMLCQEKLDGTKQNLSDQKLTHEKELTTYASLHQSKEFLDALDLININKEFFDDILRDSGSPLAGRFYCEKAFSAKMGPSKSESFPLPGSLDPGPDKLKLKRKGFISHAKEGKQQIDSHSQQSVEPESIEDICKQSAPSIAAEYREDGLKLNKAMADIIDHSSSDSPKHLKNHHGNRMVIKRFKDLKQKLKHAMKQSKKERHRITRDAILDKIPLRQGFSKDLNEDVFDQLKDLTVNRDGKDSPRSSNESDRPVCSIGRRRRRHFKRTSSLDESLERYCQLYELSFNREAKEDFSEESKSRTDGAALPRSSAQKPLGRILSSPDLRSYYYTSEDSPDAFSLQTLARSDVGVAVRISSFNEKKSVEHPSAPASHSQVDAAVKSSVEENSVDVSEINSVNRDRVGSTAAEISEAYAKETSVSNNLVIAQDIGHPRKPTSELVKSSPLPVDDSDSQDDTAASAEFSTSEDAELVRNRVPNELDSSANLQHQPAKDTTTVAGNMDVTGVAENKADIEKVEIPRKSDSEILGAQVDAKDKAKFDYVRDILELSGFSRNGSLGTWHSDNQPLDASMYDEVEGCMVLDPNCSGNEEVGNCIHLLLFDLINEVLVEIWENSYAYFPKPLSSLSHIRPMPVGYHVLEEVWAHINWYLIARPGPDQSLDYVVSRDLAKNDGWMNLQFDTECAVFELEDLIFDHLLEEVIRT